VPRAGSLLRGCFAFDSSRTEPDSRFGIRKGQRAARAWVTERRIGQQRALNSVLSMYPSTNAESISVLSQK
jgi:hypothetical protein